MKNNKVLKWIISFALVIVLFLGIYKFFGPKTTEGSKEITVQVIDAEGTSTSYNIKTDAEFLKEAMDELAKKQDFSYDGYDSDYGIFITSINGVTADYNTDAAYWAIYVNDNYGDYGIDQQPVTDGYTYTFTYERAQ